ncbi:Cation channel sperm-associated protein subunit beta [Microtus ochrogaster]|uniref:Cation channel sperm-associated protein subunit beta n=1 Tax=Microtus ochrogaster TaxID=79684 RepID=A0A8J6G335_MICOH|nr:Cation channel sperm-associated protein subunit beta [Microtus ochrogaster]
MAGEREVGASRMNPPLLEQSEPILQWSLGSKMSEALVKQLYPHVTDIRVAKCPCANDVALIGYILNSTYNEHKGLTLIDMVLTNHFLVILTSLGLFVSSDLRYPVSTGIQLSRADFCGFERVDYVKGKLWYNEKCFANREGFEADYVTITFDRNMTLSESSKRTFVSVSVLKNEKPNPQPKFPNFHFPASFSNPVGMVFHPRSHFLYVYGNEPPDLGFDAALAPQYLSPKEMLFFAHVPLNTSASSIDRMKFKNIHLGKLIKFGKNGLGIIRKLLEHTKGPFGFQTSILTEVVEPFGIESDQESQCVSASLSISRFKNHFYRITITTQDNTVIFKNSDREKTVVKPGYSSFLITEIEDSKNALSLATMPLTVTSNLTFPVHSWYLFDFGTVNGRNWNIILRPCNYWVQQNDHDMLSPNVVKYIDVGNKVNYELKLIPNTRGLRILEVPPVIVVVGNPSILKVKVEGRFDFVDSYHLKVEVASNYFHKGSTSIGLIIWEASSECPVSTMVPTMKSSCGYLRDMHYIPPRHIPHEAWASGVHKDTHGFNMIKTLPVNYRPPSNMGISIPLTDNFYHADPSKPIPRNLFHKSKETGKYKQCANATNREMCNCSEKHKLSDFLDVSDCKEKGSELFHFKLSVVPGVTFCELVEEFQIYVDEVPLPFPGHTLIAVATSVVIGGFVFIAFLFQLRNIHPLRSFRRYVRGNTANSSNISISS